MIWRLTASPVQTRSRYASRSVPWSSAAASMICSICAWRSGLIQSSPAALNYKWFFSIPENLVERIGFESAKGCRPQDACIALRQALPFIENDRKRSPCGCKADAKLVIVQSPLFAPRLAVLAGFPGFIRMPAALEQSRDRPLVSRCR